jgi:hypothetical protein
LYFFRGILTYHMHPLFYSLRLFYSVIVSAYPCIYWSSQDPFMYGLTFSILLKVSEEFYGLHISIWILGPLTRPRNISYRDRVKNSKNKNLIAFIDSVTEYFLIGHGIGIGIACFVVERGLCRELLAISPVISSSDLDSSTYEGYCRI